MSLAVDYGEWAERGAPFWSECLDVAGWDAAEQCFQMGEKSNFQIL